MGSWATSVLSLSIGLSWAEGVWWKRKGEGREDRAWEMGKRPSVREKKRGREEKKRKEKKRGVREG